MTEEVEGMIMTGEDEVGSKEDPMARAREVKGLVAYQEGTIVSRTLISKKTGTVTVFAFDQGQSLSEHTAPFDAMVHVLDGQAAITISQEPHLVKEGEMIIMPANRPHALMAKQRFKMLLIMIKEG